MDELSPEFSIKLHDEYKDCVVNFNSEFSPILTEGFNMQPIEEYNFFSDNEISLNTFATTQLDNSIRNVGPTLMRKFNEQFKKDDKGVSRNWKEIEEAKINEIFLECRGPMELII